MATVASMIYEITAQTSSIEKSMVNVTNLVDDMEKSMLSTVISGTALGGALDKLGEVGVEAFGAIAAAVPELIGHTIELGNQLFEMSMKTGASVENLSALKYVAVQAGMDFDSLTQSFFKVETALGSTGPKADKLSVSLEAVGLSMQNLKNDRPDEAFIAIVSALENVGNAADRNALAMQLFGRGAKDMAGLFHEDITQMIQDAQDLGLVMSTDQAAAAHAASVGWESFTMQLDAVAMKIASTVLPVLIALEQLAGDSFRALVDGYVQAGSAFSSTQIHDALVDVGEGFIHGLAAAAGFAQGAVEGLQNVTAVAIRTGEAIINVAAALIKVSTLGTVDEAGQTFLDKTQASLRQTYDALQVLKGGLASASDVATAAFATVERVADGMAGQFSTAYNKAGAAIADLAAKSKSAGDTVASSVESTLSPATKKFEQAMLDMDSAGQGWRGTLATIDGSVVEAIKYYLAAGVSQSSLATAYDLTNTQVKAVSSALADQNTALAANVKATAQYTTAWTHITDAANGYQTVLDTIDGTVVEAVKYYLQQGASQKDLATAYGLTADQVNAVAQALQASRNQAKTAVDSWGTEWKSMEVGWQSLEHASASMGSTGVSAIAAMSEASAAFDGDLNSNIKSVQTLAGEWITAADAKKRYDTTSSMTYDLSSDLGIKMFENLNPGAALNISTDQIESFIKGGGTLQQLIDGGAINLYAGLEATNGAPTGRTAPHFAAGGPVPSDGLIYAHAGEYVVPKSGALIGGSGGSSMPSVSVVINLSALTPGDARVSEQLRQTVEKVIVDALKTRKHLGSH